MECSLIWRLIRGIKGVLWGCGWVMVEWEDCRGEWQVWVYGRKWWFMSLMLSWEIRLFIRWPPTNMSHLS